MYLVSLKCNCECKFETNKIDKVINNYNVPFLNTDEQNVITTIWKRIHDPGNSNKINELKQALMDSVLDCVENDNVVCITGRSSKIWQSLATLDKDPNIGILKSKQYIRNEIYEKYNKIFDEFV